MSGAAGAEPSLLRRVEAAHYAIVEALWGCRRRDHPRGLRIRSEHLAEPEWNHLGRLETGARDGPKGGVGGDGGLDPDGVRDRDGRLDPDGVPDPEGVLDAAVAVGREDGRRPTVALSPLSRTDGLLAALEQRRWERSFSWAWLLDDELDGAATGWPEPDPPPGVSVAPARSAEEIAVFADLFRRVFLGEHPELVPGYRAALEASVRADGEAEVIHYLARCDGEPAGTATAVYADGVAGGFNLGVLPDFRGRGIGGALTLIRRARARRAGCDPVYLLTEDRAVETSQLRRGHRLLMRTEGWSAPAD